MTTMLTILTVTRIDGATVMSASSCVKHCPHKVICWQQIIQIRQQIRQPTKIFVSQHVWPVCRSEQSPTNRSMWTVCL